MSHLLCQFLVLLQRGSDKGRCQTAECEDLRSLTCCQLNRPIHSEGVIEESHYCQLVEEEGGKVGKGESLVGKVWETGRSSGARNGKWELKQTQVFAHLLYFQTFVILSDKIYRKSRRVDFNQKVHSELQRRRILQNGLGI